MSDDPGSNDADDDPDDPDPDDPDDATVDGAALDDARRASARGALVGLACGDALGRPVDGASGAAVRAGHGRVTEMLGADGRRAGSTTAVTAAALDAANRLLGRDPDGHRRTGAGGASGPAATADAGPTLARAIPCALVRGPVERRADAIGTALADAGVDAGGGDAGDGEAAEACVALGVVVGRLADGESVGDALAAARTAAVERGAPVAVREALSVVGDPAAVSLDADGGVVSTMEAGLHEAVAADGPEGAVVPAVSRGGAASATGAVAGAVAGARFGPDALPARWLNELAGVDDLLDVADALAGASLDA